MSFEPGNNSRSRAGFILDAQRDLYTFTAFHFVRHAFSFSAAYCIAGCVIVNFHSNEVPFRIFISRDDDVAATSLVVHCGPPHFEVLFFDKASAGGTAGCDCMWLCQVRYKKQ